jgi:hypothetical protein
MRFKLFLLIIILIFFYFCDKKDGDTLKWQGSIEKKGEITIVHNPGEPLFKDFKLDLEEQFTLGYQEDENYIFYHACDIALDSKENLYILDSGNYRIQVFNPLGKYVKTIGRRGQGPGEFPAFSYTFDITENDDIYVLFKRRIDKLNSQGKFEKSINIPFGVVDFYIASKENMYANFISHDEKGEKRSIIKLNNKGEILKEYFSFRKLKDEHKTRKFIRQLPLFLTKEGKLIYGTSYEYCFYITSGEKTVDTKVCCAAQPLPFADAERKLVAEQLKNRPKRVQEKLKVPPFREFIYRIFVDDHGYIWISANPNYTEKEFVHDVFDSQGGYLYRFVLEYFPYTIRNQYFYSVITDPDIGSLVQKVKMKNWPPEYPPI